VCTVAGVVFIVYKWVCEEVEGVEYEFGGVEVDGERLKLLLYADDIVVFAESAGELRSLLG
jgi:hypothetical protein